MKTKRNGKSMKRLRTHEFTKKQVRERLAGISYPFKATNFTQARVVGKPGKYLLIYSAREGRLREQVKNGGTGPFKTLRAAKAWFLDGGL